MSAACLVIIFNHAYPGNVSKLRRLYGTHFSDILFLIPNQRLDDPACFTYYRGAFSFAGAVADARAMLAARRADCYVFAADDLILNPRLTERTARSMLGLDTHEGFLAQFGFLGGTCHGGGAPEQFTDVPPGQWPWANRVVSRLNTRDVMFGSGAEGFANHLPDAATAMRRFSRYGTPALTFEIPRPGRRPLGRRLRRPPPAATAHPLPFPLAYGIADIFAVVGEKFDLFAHYLGVLASIDLFAEVAVPTALLLAADDVATCHRLGLEFAWTYTGSAASRRLPRPASLAALRESLRPQDLFIHPVKPSDFPA